MESTVPQQSSSDYTYEDDFEELDSFIKEKENDSSESNAKISPRSKSSTNKGDGPRADSRTLDSDVHEEKGQRESSGQVPMEKDKVKGAPTFDDLQSDDSEPEPEGDVMFTQDQHRAMMELMAQKHDSGDYTGTPQEYTLKGRLKELNAELAKEPEPDDRRHRVGFKKELVDLVAPAPEVSDDDDDDDYSPRKALPDSADRDNKKQFVVERDGKFDILAHHELSASERAMFNIAGEGGGDTGPDLSEKTSGGGTAWQEKTGGPSRTTLGSEDNWQPQPPSKPRPNTANDGCRRSVHVSPRPRTAASPGRSTNANHGPALQDFNYSSPYAMSSTEKERAQERARLRDQQRMEEERRRQEEEEYRRQESEDAFRAWLQHKSDDGRRKRHDNDDRKRRDSKDDKPRDFESDGSEGMTPPAQERSFLNIPLSSECFQHFFPPQAKENDEAFRGWLRQKQTQQKREKLLKKREEQGVKDSYFVRSREECDMAYKEWLKKKYTEFRQQRVTEKERQKSLMGMARKARKQQLIARTLRQNQAVQFTDLHEYRF